MAFASKLRLQNTAKSAQHCRTKSQPLNKKNENLTTHSQLLEKNTLLQQPRQPLLRQMR